MRDSGVFLSRYLHRIRYTCCRPLGHAARQHEILERLAKNFTPIRLQDVPWWTVGYYSDFFIYWSQGEKIRVPHDQAPWSVEKEEVIAQALTELTKLRKQLTKLEKDTISMKTTADLRQKLLSLWQEYENGTCDVYAARVHIGFAKTVLDSLKVELAAAHLNQPAPPMLLLPSGK